MGVGIWRQSESIPRVTWLTIFFIALIYFSLVSAATEWLTQTDSTDDTSSARKWRVWGTVGFVIPAWLYESVFPLFGSSQPSFPSYDSLLTMAGWSGLSTAFCAILLAEQSAKASPATPDSTEQRIGFSLGATFVLMVIVQRCSHVWTAPFFDHVILSHGIEKPFVYRLVSMSHVFELVGLYFLGFGIVLTGIRTALAFGTIAWLARTALLASIASGVDSDRTALALLFASQILAGLGGTAFFGALGAFLRNSQLQKSRVRPELIVACSAGAAGTLLGGAASHSVFTATPDNIALNDAIVAISSTLSSLGLTSTLPTETLPRWSILWWLLSILPLAALPFLLFSRLRPSTGANIAD
jgi:hypothetical protein